MTPIRQAAIDALPEPQLDVVSWLTKYMRIPLGARGDQFDPWITPWAIEPLRCIEDPATRVMTYVKPVQCGGSNIGEGIILFWIGTDRAGTLQYNWPTTEKAEKRWKERTKRILEACQPVKERWPLPTERSKVSSCSIIFPCMNFSMQGVFAEDNLDSTTVPLQVNEEIHSWEPGRLKKASNRQTAVWNAKQINISNASKKGDQLHRAFLAGTQEHWEVLCPGCGQFHEMRTKWKDEEPELGGLRYDSTGCKLENGQYDYNKLAPTIRYQFPCGHTISDDHTERRKLSLSGRYGAPKNVGATMANRSFILDSVSVDYIPWLSLIQEKHSALLALKFGDREPWYRYQAEKECVFFEDDDIPTFGQVIVTSDFCKCREGLEGRATRLFAVDRQRGSINAGETPFWWMVIRDVMPNGDSMLIYEGKILADADAISILNDHTVEYNCGVVDSGWDTHHVYRFGYKYGINAIKGADVPLFTHEEERNGNKVTFRKIWEAEVGLYTMINNCPSRYPVNGYMKGLAKFHPKEPLFWRYSKAGIRDRLAWIRSPGSAVKWEVPADVSADYKEHMQSEELRVEQNKFGETVKRWVQVKKHNDLYVCECYIAMLMEIGGFIGEQEIEQEEQKTNE